LEDCIVYLVWQLRQNGFEVRFTWPNLLYISWRHHEGDYLTKHNPIIKAMIPEPIAPPKPSSSVPVPAKKKAQPAVSFQREIDMISAYGPVSQPRPVAPRRAIDYEPPASFLQNMDRPVKDVKGNVLADLWSFN